MEAMSRMRYAIPSNKDRPKKGEHEGAVETIPPKIAPKSPDTPPRAQEAPRNLQEGHKRNPKRVPTNKMH